MSKSQPLEFSEESWRRCGAVAAAEAAAFRMRHALAELPGVPGKLVPLSEGKAAMAPRPEVPRAVETAMVEFVSGARQMTESRHEVPGAELQHEPALTRVRELPRHESQMPSLEAAAFELERVTAAPEVTELLRLE